MLRTVRLVLDVRHTNLVSLLRNGFNDFRPFADFRCLYQSGGFERSFPSGGRAPGLHTVSVRESKSYRITGKFGGYFNSAILSKIVKFKTSVCEHNIIAAVATPETPN